MRKSLLAALAAVSWSIPSAFAEPYAFTLSDATWKRAVDEIREQLRTRRPGDVYDDSWLTLVDADRIDFQGAAVWMELSIKATSLKTTLEDTLDALSSPEMVEKAKAYAERYREELRAAYRESCPTPEHPNRNPVPPSADVAVKCIETGLDWDSLTLYPTLATLVSFAAVTKPYVQAEMIDQNFLSQLKDIPVETFTLTRRAQAFLREQPKTITVTGKLFHNKILGPDYQRRAVWVERANSRGGFVFKQLFDFLNNAEISCWSQEKTLAIEGSWIGAYSHSQGIPSTLANHQKRYPDFDPDSMEHCFIFTTVELQRCGWGNKAPDDVFYGYNRASWYAKYCAHMEGVLREDICKIVGVNYPQPLVEDAAGDLPAFRPVTTSH